MLLPLLLWTFCLQQFAHDSGASGECVMEIRSGERRNGTLMSDGYPTFYKTSLNCFYKLIARPTERVRFQLLDLSLRGNAPLCNSDYLDIYPRFRDLTAVNDVDILNYTPIGRFCGDVGTTYPHLIISERNFLALHLVTDPSGSGENDTTITTHRGFMGIYEFVDAGIYSEFGERLPTGHNDSNCSFVIQQQYAFNKEGQILAPTYPGVYFDHVNCIYYIRALVGYRIQLKFIDFNLFFGGPHCPHDFVRIYDSGTIGTGEPLIGVFCGSVKSGTSLFSKSTSLTIEFRTGSSGRRAFRGELAEKKKKFFEPLDDFVMDRRGFVFKYLMRDDFVKLDFIDRGQHIRGTECDQRIMSGGVEEGWITSPNFGPNNVYPIGVQCFVIIDGLMDWRSLEKVRLQFADFSVVPYNTSCRDGGSVSVWINGQEPDDGRWPAPDLVLCGSFLPADILSNHPRLTLLFNSTNAIASTGFRAKYTFEKFYAIPGRQLNRSCHYTYGSNESLEGVFYSPHHSLKSLADGRLAFYPPNTTCVYDFFAWHPQLRIRVTFQVFSVGNKTERGCSNDYVAIFNMRLAGGGRGGEGATRVELEEQPLDILCGMDTPGPMLTEPGVSGLRVVFQSGATGRHYGFLARYAFIVLPTDLQTPVPANQLPQLADSSAPPPYGTAMQQCFKNFTGVHGGYIVSPNYPQQYRPNMICDWLIVTNHRDSKILISFEDLSMEGDKKPDGMFLCNTAVVNLYALSLDYLDPPRPVVQMVLPRSLNYSANLETDANATVAPADMPYSLVPLTRQIRRLPKPIAVCSSAGSSPILLEAPVAKIRFITSDEAVGAKGFMIAWTEVMKQTAGAEQHCRDFKCKISGYCISMELVCNQLHNCGYPADMSDEDPYRCKTGHHLNVVNIVVSVLSVLLLLVLVLVCVVHKRRKCRQQAPRGRGATTAGCGKSEPLRQPKSRPPPPTVPARPRRALPSCPLRKRPCRRRL